MTRFYLDKKDFEIGTEKSDDLNFNIRMKEIKIVYPQGIEQFEINDDVEVFITFESQE